MTVFRFETVLGEVDGLRTLFVVPIIPDGAPEPVREGIARRRLATIVGTCPCGARRPRLSRQQHRQIERERFHGRLDVAHEPGCPATDDRLAAAIRAWIGGAR